MKCDAGMHLVEVLVGLFLFSTMLIGIDAMLIQTTRETKSLYFLQVSMQQLLQLHEQLLLGDLTLQQLQRWNQQNQQLLPNAYGDVQQAGEKTKLSLYWHTGTRSSCNPKNRIACLAIEIPSFS